MAAEVVTVTLAVDEDDGSQVEVNLVAVSACFSQARQNGSMDVMGISRS